MQAKVRSCASSAVLAGSLAVALAFTAGGVSAAGADLAHSFWRYVTKSGDIKRPPDNQIRRNWVHLGTWAIPKLKGASGPGMHDVYAERWVVDAFNKTHAWPDGAVLVKQVHAISKGARTTGPEVYWEGKTGVWFVMIKDNKGRFPKDARWGEGWGWGLFKADNPDTNVNMDWKKGTLGNCFACHVPAKDTGWVYLEGYPVLNLSDEQQKHANAR